MERRSGGIRGRVLVVMTGLVLLAGCSRNTFVLTECANGQPAVERVADVAPPNC